MENNPLRQYFRRPAVYMKLPSNGVGYPEGSLDMPPNGELPVYPMTAIDEITVRTPDALFNGSAVMELIKSCVPNILDPWSVTNVDIDAILVAIKTASSELGEMDLDSQCPECEDISTYKINLAALLSNIGSPDFDNTLQLGDLNIKFRPINFKTINEASLEQFEVQRITANIDSITDDAERNSLVESSLKKITDLTMRLLSSSIDYIETEAIGKVEENVFILDLLKNCDKNMFEKIRDFSLALREKSEIKPVTIKCANCEHEYSQAITLNPTDFFG